MDKILGNSNNNSNESVEGNSKESIEKEKVRYQNTAAGRSCLRLTRGNQSRVGLPLNGVHPKAYPYCRWTYPHCRVYSKLPCGSLILQDAHTAAGTLWCRGSRAKPCRRAREGQTEREDAAGRNLRRVWHQFSVHEPAKKNGMSQSNSLWTTLKRTGSTMRKELNLVRHCTEAVFGKSEARKNQMLQKI